MIGFLACHSVSSSKQKNIIEDLDGISKRESDTSRISILPINAGYWQMPKDAKETGLNESELRMTEVLLKECINAANDSSQNLKIYTVPYLDLATYKRQYIPYISAKGDKIVWINCFCENFPSWREKVVYVQDGGSYFFNVEINLTKGYYGMLYINSSA